ncbi:unnamed protein product, partial [marine sediment metagenome]
ARVINAKPDEIAYTKNTTEAINIVAHGLKLRKGDKVVATVLEHHSNLLPWQRLERELGVKLELIQASRECMIDPAAIKARLPKRMAAQTSKIPNTTVMIAETIAARSTGSLNILTPFKRSCRT